MTEPTIRRLEPERLDDYLTFFDHDAFADNPDWQPCYCMFFQFEGGSEAWDAMTAEGNRAEVSERIRTGRADGLLAYVDNRPVGWCQAADPADLGGFQRALKYTAPPETGVITCFVVAAGHRRQGIARRLLEAACAQLEAKGFRYVEAFPKAGGHDDAENFPGPLKLYLEAGFEEVGSTPTKRLVVRKALG